MRALDLRRGGARGGGGSTSHVGADAGCSATPASSRGYKTSPRERRGAAAAPASVQPPAAGARRPAAQRCQPKSCVLLKLSRCSPPPGLPLGAHRSRPAATLASAAARGSRALTWPGPEHGGGGAFMRPHALHPSTAPGPELRAPSAGPSRARNFASAAALGEEAESAPSVRPGPHHRARRPETQSDIPWRLGGD